MARNSRARTAFSKRDSVGCEARPKPRERIAAHHEFVDRVVDQPGGVVAVGVACAQPEDALLHELDRLVQDFAWFSRVVETGGQPLAQAQLGVQGFDQHQAAVGAGVVRQVEAGDDRLRKPVALEGHLRYTVCSHRASSHWGLETSHYRFYSTNARLDGSSLSFFVNFPG